jgi:hypothetical protein
MTNRSNFAIASTVAEEGRPISEDEIEEEDAGGGGSEEEEDAGGREEGGFSCNTSL